MDCERAKYPTEWRPRSLVRERSSSPTGSYLGFFGVAIVVVVVARSSLAARRSAARDRLVHPAANAELNNGTKGPAMLAH